MVVPKASDHRLFCMGGKTLFTPPTEAVLLFRKELMCHWARRGTEELGGKLSSAVVKLLARGWRDGGGESWVPVSTPRTLSVVYIKRSLDKTGVANL